MVGVVCVFAERLYWWISYGKYLFLGNCTLMANVPGKIEEYVDNFLAEVCKQDDFNQEFCNVLK